MSAEELNKRWEAFSAHNIAPEMTFEGNFLVVGARTHLAKVGAELDEPRLTALLAAAHGRRVAAASLRHIQRALEKKRDGDLVLALIHLALSGVAKLEDPKEGGARRLFLADALMNEGVAPSVILKGLGFDPPSLGVSLGKYNPDQPRVPPGNPNGGQWTNEDWTGTTDSSQSRHPKGVQVADASAIPGHQVKSDAPTGALPRGTTASPLGASNAADSSSSPFELAQADLDQTCSTFIAANCKASILRVFPGQYLDCTLREVQAAAKAGDAAARSACKLLKRGEYRK